MGAPAGGTQVHPGDLLVLYGQEDGLKALDSRPRGAEGDAQHAAAGARQRRQAAVDAVTDR